MNDGNLEIKSSIDYFNNKNKINREKWVLEQFLNYLSIPFLKEDILSSSKEPNDVFYKNTGFQIKEILTECRKRHQEYKNEYEYENKNKNENENENNFFGLVNPNYIEFTTTFKRIKSELENYRTEKYKEKTKQINLLIYLNLTNWICYTDKVIDLSELKSELIYWNSVSLITNKRAIVFHYDELNDFLDKPKIGKLFRTYAKNFYFLKHTEIKKLMINLVDLS